MNVLNVGSGPAPWYPEEYSDWGKISLDIDPNVGADLCIDARKIDCLAPNQFEAVFCSHNLEHYGFHEVPSVLKGILHVLKPFGHVSIAVPNLLAVMRKVVAYNLDLSDVYYTAPCGPITYHDVVFGYGPKIASGNQYSAHRCGFSKLSLSQILEKSGFQKVLVTEIDTDLHAFGYKLP